MAVDFLYVPAESPPFVGQGIGAVAEVGAAVGHQAVEVEESGEVVEFVVGGAKGGFPDLALGHFAVAADAVDLVGLAVDFEARRHAAGQGEALAQGAGVGLDAGRGEHVRVALQHRAEGLDLFHFLLGEVAAFGQGGILHQGGVTQHYSTARDLATLAMALQRDFPEHYHYFSELNFTYNGIPQGNRNPLLYRNMNTWMG